MVSARLDAVRAWRNPPCPQGFGAYIDDGSGCRCALGQLAGEMAATNADASRWLSQNLKDVYGIRMGHKIGARPDQVCPLCLAAMWAGKSMIVHWNDGHRLSLAEIAGLAEQHPRLVFGRDDG